LRPLTIAPSILCRAFAELGEEIRAICAGADVVHVDAMEGHFAPNIARGADVAKALRAQADKVFDAHSMIAPCAPDLETFAEAAPRRRRSPQAIRALGKNGGRLVAGSAFFEGNPKV
jgi:ribulose-phosphate 3-epimerase